jgi:putative SOS response-associated peptidase YedK
MDGEPLEIFTILTTEPNEVMTQIHNRMSVIPEPKDSDHGLDAWDNFGTIEGKIEWSFSP